MEITVSRPVSYRDVLRSYRILVDGVPQALIRGGEMIWLDLSPGEHRVSARLFWTGSRELPIVVADEPIALDVRLAGNLLSSLARVFTRRSYLSVTLVPV